MNSIFDQWLKHLDKRKVERPVPGLTQEFHAVTTHALPHPVWPVDVFPREWKKENEERCQKELVIVQCSNFLGDLFCMQDKANKSLVTSFAARFALQFHSKSFDVHCLPLLSDCECPILVGENFTPQHDRIHVYSHRRLFLSDELHHIERSAFLQRHEALQGNPQLSPATSSSGQEPDAEARASATQKHVKHKIPR